MADKVAMTKTQSVLAERSPLGVYKELQVGPAGTWWQLACLELYNLVARDIPGVGGFLARTVLSSRLLGSGTARCILGKSVLLRSPARIVLGQRTVVDDYAVLDARGADAKIVFGKHCLLGRSSSVIAKNAQITLSDGVNIGTHCRIATQSSITIGASTLIAAYCYIGPGNHQQGDSETPLIEKEMELKGGVQIGSNCWIGARATILDGVTIGDNAIVGAHSLVREDVPAGVVVAGTPAKIIKRL